MIFSPSVKTYGFEAPSSEEAFLVNSEYKHPDRFSMSIGVFSYIEVYKNKCSIKIFAPKIISITPPRNSALDFHFAP